MNDIRRLAQNGFDIGSTISNTIVALHIDDIDLRTGLYAGYNYCQSHVLVDTWIWNVKPVYKEVYLTLVYMIIL